MILTTPQSKLGWRLSRPLLLFTSGSVIALAIVVALLGRYLRQELQAQMLSRDVELLASVVALEYDQMENDLSGLPPDFRSLAVSASALRGVLAMAIYRPDGWLEESVPLHLMVSDPLPAKLLSRSASDGYGHFHPRFVLESIYTDHPAEDAARVPITEILVPVRHVNRGEPVAYARYWLEGASVAQKFDDLDRNLWFQGLAAWLIGSSLILLVGLASARGLRRIGGELEHRTESLQQANAELERANTELELAARSSAIGAISAHLIHGLRNPLAGLGAYLRAHGSSDAREAAFRMENLVRDTLAVLRSQSRPRGHGELTLHELGVILRSRVQSQAQAAVLSLHFRFDPWGGERFSGRDANLILLILENLVVNAMEASPPTGTIQLEVDLTETAARFSVSDEGTGIPEGLRKNLFQPGHSTKSNGSGLGLAISRQLAQSLGGDLYLSDSTDAGSRFVLETPHTVNRPTCKTPHVS